MSGLHCRALRADEIHRFHDHTGPVTDVGRRWTTFDEEVAAGGYRPEWVWVAEHDEAIIARAAFWAPADADHPWTLDLFDPPPGPGGVEIGARLLRAAYATLVTPDWHALPHPDSGRPDYHLFLPDDWQERADARAEANQRMASAEAAGLVHRVGRVNVRWTPDDGLPARSTRLSFVPADDDEVVLEVLEREAVDSLDADDQEEMAKGGPARAARRTLEDVASFPGGRGRWRLGVDADGTVVGIVMGTRNPNSATIGYIGVAADHRGRGYAVDLLSEALHIFAAESEPHVNDATDEANLPMQRVFTRCNYRVVGRRVIFA